MMEERLHLEMEGGGLAIPPGPHIEKLKAALTYTAKVFAEEEFSFVDRNGQRKSGTRKTKRINFVKKSMFREAPDGGIMTYDGMLSRVSGVLSSLGIEASVARNGYSHPAPKLDRSIVRGLLPDQVGVFTDAISQVWDGEGALQCGAVIDATMGYGKTHLIAALCRAYAASGVVVTTKSSAVVDRLERGLGELLEQDGISVGKRKGSKYKPGSVVVCTSAVLDRFDPREVGCLIYDEVHNAAAPVQTRNLVKFHNSVRFGLSGTVGDRFDGRHNLIEAVFGTKCSRVTDEEAEDLGRVVPMKVFVVPVDRGPSIADCKSPVAAERRAIWNNAYRNRRIAQAVGTVPVDWQVLVFSRTLGHASNLVDNYLDEGFELYHGDLSPDERERILRGFESGDLLRVVATDAMGEGVDPARLRVVVDVNWTSSDTKVSQRAGRGRRKAPGKTVGYLIAFDDRFDPSVQAKSRKRIAIYRDRGYEIKNVENPEDIRYDEDQ